METKVDIALESQVYDSLYDDRGEEEGNGKRLGDKLPSGLSALSGEKEEDMNTYSLPPFTGRALQLRWRWWLIPLGEALLWQWLCL